MYNTDVHSWMQLKHFHLQLSLRLLCACLATRLQRLQRYQHRTRSLHVISDVFSDNTWCTTPVQVCLIVTIWCAITASLPLSLKFDFPCNEIRQSSADYRNFSRTQFSFWCLSRCDARRVCDDCHAGFIMAKQMLSRCCGVKNSSDCRLESKVLRRLSWTVPEAAIGVM